MLFVEYSVGVVGEAEVVVVVVVDDGLRCVRRVDWKDCPCTAGELGSGGESGIGHGLIQVQLRPAQIMTTLGLCCALVVHGHGRVYICMLVLRTST
jgi:hypothetical protein